MDNFNWGVRRPSLSHLDGAVGGLGESEARLTHDSLNDITPVLPKREVNSRVGAEESSDDEMGSVSKLRHLLPTHLIFNATKSVV